MRIASGTPSAFLVKDRNGLCQKGKTLTARRDVVRDCGHNSHYIHPVVEHKRWSNDDHQQQGLNINDDQDFINSHRRVHGLPDAFGNQLCH